MSEYDEFSMSPEVIAIISDAAARAAVREYQKQEEKNSVFKKRCFQARKILENYRDLKLLVARDKFKPTPEEIADLSYKYSAAMMEDRETKVDKIIEEEMNSRVRTYVQVKEIDEALKLLKESSRVSKSDDRMRQYRAIERRYLVVDKMTVEEIAEMESVSTATTNRDLKAGIARFAFYLRPDLEFFM